LVEDVVDHPAEERDVTAGAQRTCRSTGALVRVNRGSMCDLGARALASITHWNPTGCASAMFEPMITMKSELARSC
jgi:hypothetical protein